jgi:benzoyl-CoA reductase/2-hydroxyglutaryl-CoA dehydratase subunit BcrC/BadD/HgdB
MPPSALDRLELIYRSGPSTAIRSGAGSAPVVGYVGADVPVELLDAAGVFGVRLAGDPTADRSRGDRLLGRGLDPATRSLMSQLVSGQFDGLDALVVSRDCEASLRLFYAVRELRRVDPGCGLPPVHLLDLLHLPYRTTTTYNLARLTGLRDWLRAWTGNPVTDDDLARSVLAHGEVREQQRRVAAYRRGPQARLTGTQALAVVGAGTRTPLAAYRSLLGDLLSQLEQGSRPPIGGVATFLTGSSHDNPHVYAALEAQGVRIVGEDHDWGDLLIDRQVDRPTLLGLAETYQHQTPTAQRGSIRDRGVQTAVGLDRSGAQLLVGYLRECDEGPPWDWPEQSRLATQRGVDTILLAHQGYGAVDIDTLGTTVALSTSGGTR